MYDTFGKRIFAQEPSRPLDGEKITTEAHIT